MLAAPLLRHAERDVADDEEDRRKQADVDVEHGGGKARPHLGAERRGKPGRQCEDAAGVKARRHQPEGGRRLQCERNRGSHSKSADPPPCEADDVRFDPRSEEAFHPSPDRPDAPEKQRDGTGQVGECLQLLLHHKLGRSGIGCATTSQRHVGFAIKHHRQHVRFLLGYL